MVGIAAEEGELVFGQELGDRRANLALLVEHEVGEPLRPPLLGERLEPVELGARELLRDADEPHGGRIGEDAELGVARELGRILDLELEAQIGLVRAVAVVRLLPGHATERAMRRLTVERLEARADGALDHVPDVLANGERHLDVQLPVLELAVGAEILVSQAGRDLVVAVEPGHHQDLLEQLR